MILRRIREKIVSKAKEYALNNYIDQSSWKRRALQKSSVTG
jgi:hypothetical protein